VSHYFLSYFWTVTLEYGGVPRHFIGGPVLRITSTKHLNPNGFKRPIEKFPEFTFGLRRNVLIRFRTKLNSNCKPRLLHRGCVIITRTLAKTKLYKHEKIDSRLPNLRRVFKRRLSYLTSTSPVKCLKKKSTVESFQTVFFSSVYNDTRRFMNIINENTKTADFGFWFTFRKSLYPCTCYETDRWTISEHIYSLGGENVFRVKRIVFVRRWT